MKFKMCHWFTVDDLVYLRRGGRISSASEIIGSVLKIKPVLKVNREGKLVNVTKARGRKFALKTLIDKINECGEDLENVPLFLTHSDCEEDAKAFAKEIKANTKVKEVVISYIGSVIGAHTGPGTIAVFFMGKERDI